jgi:hypothetical protein
LFRKGQKKMKTVKITGIIAIIGIILGMMLSACGAAAPATPTTDPGAVYTMAAATVQSQLTQAAAANPTAVPPTVTPEPKPTDKPTEEPTQAIAQQPTLPFASGAATALPTVINGLNPYLAPTSAQPAGFQAGDVAQWQYNIPADNAAFYPGTPFQMEVGIKNVGSVTWTTNYTLKYIDGQQMSGVTSIPLKTAVKPGEKAIFITDLHAPGEPNSTSKPYYKTLWELTTQNGIPVTSGRVYIQIIVKRE